MLPPLTQYAAEDPCFVPDTNVPCKCPLDRIGPSCETGRPFTCTFELLSPQPECKPLLGTGNAPLDGDPPCFTRCALTASGTRTLMQSRWTRNQEILWVYNVRCAFLNTTGLDVRHHRCHTCAHTRAAHHYAPTHC